MGIEGFTWASGVECCVCGFARAVNALQKCHTCAEASGRFAAFVRARVEGQEPDLDRLAIRNLFKVKGGTVGCRDLEKSKIAIKREFEAVLPADGRGYYIEGTGQILIVWDCGAVLFQP
jgi:hypothetical protein